MGKRAVPTERHGTKFPPLSGDRAAGGTDNVRQTGTRTSSNPFVKPVAIAVAVALSAWFAHQAKVATTQGKVSPEIGAVQEFKDDRIGQVRDMPHDLRKNWECASRCASMTPGDLQVIDATLRQAGCDPAYPGDHVLCSTTPEQICVGACGGGQQDMSTFLPGAFGSAGANPAGLTRELEKIHTDYMRCAERCSREGVVVDVSNADAAAEALKTLERCGVVQLAGGYDIERLNDLQLAIDKLDQSKKAYKKLVDRTQLHDGRFQVYLPFKEPFNNRETIGASNLVLSVLEGYFGNPDFGIDHVSILTSESPSGNQSLHPDVPFFRRMAVSVHTALVDVTAEMGPTFFCPCTGELSNRDAWPGSAAIKMTTLLHKACFGSSFAPAFTARGTVTIYDSAMFHMGLANGSGKKRPVLKLEIGAGNVPQRRNYIQGAPPAGQKQTRRFRDALGPPSMGSSRGPHVK